MKVFAAVLLTMICFSAEAAERWSYGYISTNVDCRESGKPARIKFVSQTFAYCAADVPRHQIIEDNKIFFRQVAQTSCGDNYSVSYEYVNVADSEERCERDRQQSLREPGYGKYVQWHASVDYPSSRCR